MCTYSFSHFIPNKHTTCIYLEQWPATLLVQEGGDHRHSSELPHCILSHLSTGMSAGDVAQGTDSRFNDVLPTTTFDDSLEQSLCVWGGERERERERERKNECACVCVIMHVCVHVCVCVCVCLYSIAR